MRHREKSVGADWHPIQGCVISSTPSHFMLQSLEIKDIFSVLEVGICEVNTMDKL